MKKPEKETYNRFDGGNYEYMQGFNQSYDLWEAYHNWKMSQLPGVDELEKIIDNYGTSKLQTRTVRMLIATAISKRIKKE